MVPVQRPARVGHQRRRTLNSLLKLADSALILLRRHRLVPRLPIHLQRGLVLGDEGVVLPVSLRRGRVFAGSLRRLAKPRDLPAKLAVAGVVLGTRPRVTIGDRLAAPRR
jgi:hypothetical protein